MSILSLRPIHPFPARMASELALEHISLLPRGAKVLDPMCGSGTVLRAATEHGVASIGVDLDPLAVMVSRSWTSKVDFDSVDGLLDRVLHASRGRLGEDLHLPWIDNCSDTQAFVSFWFEARQVSELRALSSVLVSLSGQAADLLRVALSRTIVTKENGASLARDTSHSRPHRWFFDNKYDVFQGFERAVADIKRKLKPHMITSAAEVVLGDARNLREFGDSSIDGIVTSPPYLNAIDYMRGHRLALVWLGYSIPDLRRIQATSIGTERKGDSVDPGELAEWIEEAMVGETELPQKELRMIRRYAIDLKSMVLEQRRVLTPGGRMIMVIGDSRLRGVDVLNSVLLQRIAEAGGFQLEDKFTRHLPSTNRYLPFSSRNPTSSLDKRMKEESVMTFV